MCDRWNHVASSFLIAFVFSFMNGAVSGQINPDGTFPRGTTPPLVAFESCREWRPVSVYCPDTDMSFSPILRARRTKVGVNESIVVYLGGDIRGGRTELLNVFLEPEWPVGLFVAVYDREHKYLGRFVPPGRKPDALAPSEAWHLPRWLRTAGARFLIRQQDWIGDDVLTKPGIYYLQAIGTLRMVGKRPGEMDDEYGQVTRRRWFHPLCDQEMCRSPAVKIEVVDSPSPAEELPENDQVFQDANGVSFISRISLPIDTNVRIGEKLILNVFVENPSKSTVYLYDPHCFDGPTTPNCRADLMLTSSSSTVSRNLIKERTPISNTYSLPLRLPPNGWCEARMTATHNWNEEQECVLQLIYHKDVFLSQTAYEMTVNAEDDKLLIQSHLDVDAPRHQVASNRLVVKPTK